MQRISNALKGLQRLRRLEQIWWETKDPVWGIPTGFHTLDRLVGGLHPSETIVIGARPSVGKSSFISQVAFNVAMGLLAESVEAGEPVGKVVYFTPEMGYPDLFSRQAAQFSEVPSTLVKSGDETPEQREAFHAALEGIENLLDVMDVYAEGRVDYSDVVNKVTTTNAIGPPVKLVLVDYLTRLTAGAVTDDHKRANIISRELKDLAIVEDVPVLIGAQLSRKGVRTGSDEDPTSRYPQITDLRDSGKIEEDADGVWLVHREDQYLNDRRSGMQPATLIVAKNRNGPTGIVDLMFEPQLTRFSDLNRGERDAGW